jgi:NAD(P)-dependent dehydrogenase (short-subunit alcohol dehydrogenase family)
MNLAGKTVMITGGRRVGSELALLLAERGANLVMTYLRSRDRIVDVIAQIRKRDAKGLAVAADLRQPAEVDKLVSQAINYLGSIDCLVNMTSVFQPTQFADLTPEQFDDCLAVNLKAPYLTAVAVARVMQRQPVVDGLQGKIVNFADWATERPYRHHLPYLIAKGGIVTMTKALAVELTPTITVNAIAPAMIDPPPHLSAEDIEDIRRASPLNRIGRPTDANRLVLYLLEGTDFVTGEVYRVDGGRFLGAGED